jgi:hypothetical protein
MNYSNPPSGKFGTKLGGGKGVEPNIEPCQTVPGFTNLPFLHTLVHPRYWPGPWVDVHGCKKVLLSSKIWRDISAQQSEE